MMIDLFYEQCSLHLGIKLTFEVLSNSLVLWPMMLHEAVFLSCNFKQEQTSLCKDIFARSELRFFTSEFMYAQ